MRVSRYIAEWLKRKVDYVFGIQGGAVVHLFDACERFGPKPIYCHHEQAAAFAAGSYSRTHGFGACIVTTGPGATNAITPCLGAWQDSIPCIFISGQARTNQVSYGTKVRQIGSQEAPICNNVANITKVAIYANDAMAVKHALNFAYEKSMNGRPGPVWLDVPLDVQWSELPIS